RELSPMSWFPNRKSSTRAQRAESVLLPQLTITWKFTNRYVRPKRQSSRSQNSHPALCRFHPRHPTLLGNARSCLITKPASRPPRPALISPAKPAPSFPSPPSGPVLLPAGEGHVPIGHRRPSQKSVLRRLEPLPVPTSFCRLAMV